MQNPLLADRSSAHARSSVPTSSILHNVIKKLGGESYGLILLLTLVFALCFPQHSRAQSNSCNADSACTNWGAWTIVTDSVPIVLNGDTCYVKFRYQWRLCPTPVKIQIKTFEMTFPDSSCAFGPYLDSLNNNNSNDLWPIVENMLAQADRRFGEKRFLIHRTNYPPSSNFDCSYSVGCNSIAGLVEVVTYYSECRDYIAVGAPGGGVSPSCPGISYVVDCNSDDCCILSRKMCYDNSTGKVRVCETSSPGSGTSNCTGNGTYTPPPGCSIVWRSGCRSVSCP